MSASHGASADRVMIVNPSNFRSRWLTYFRERFPLGRHGVLVAVFTIGSLCFTIRLRGDRVFPDTFALVPAFITTFLFFLQLRLADEFKDYEEDLRWRPYRPVPRGLITLRELGTLWVLTAVVQLFMALMYDFRLTLLLLVVWAYLGLMSVEFFVPRWLKARPMTYMTTHSVIIPLICLYITAHDWIPAGVKSSSRLLWFLAMTYCNSFVIEIGRKIRAPADEEEGVQTYSVLWGQRGAVMAWLGALVATAGFALMAAQQIGFLMPIAFLAGLCVVAAAATSFRFLAEMKPGRGKVFELASALWTVLSLLAVGPAAVLYAMFEGSSR